MRDAFEEFVLVIAHSTKTKLAALLGVAFFIGMMAAGAYFTSQVEIHGVFAPLAEVIRERITDRYDKAAWGALISFFLLAAKCYKKDRKRFLGL